VRHADALAAEFLIEHAIMKASSREAELRVRTIVATIFTRSEFLEIADDRSTGAARAAAEEGP